MGWTGVYTGTLTPSEKKAYLDKNFTWERIDKDGIKYGMKIIRSQMVGSTYFAAARPYGHENKVFAIVTLTQMNKGEFMYKEMTEDSGPGDVRCPKSIMDLLDDTDCDYAKSWRKAVYEYHELRHKKNTATFGEILQCKCPHEISWGDGFTIAKDELFFVKVEYLRPYSTRKTKAYVLQKVRDGNYYSMYKRIMKKTFDRCEVTKVSNGTV